MGKSIYYEAPPMRAYVQKAQPVASSLTVAYDGVSTPLVVGIPQPKQKVQKASTRSMSIEEAYRHLGIRRPRSLAVTKATAPAANLARYQSGRFG